jgi:hypothetical protein
VGGEGFHFRDPLGCQPRVFADWVGLAGQRRAQEFIPVILCRQREMFPRLGDDGFDLGGVHIQLGDAGGFQVGAGKTAVG